MNYPLFGRWPRPSPLATLFRRPRKGLRQKAASSGRKEEMVKKMVETWHRVVAGELPEALDGLRRTTPSSTRRSWRNQTNGAAQGRSATREGHDHRPNRKSQFKSVRGTRFAVRDKEDARCRSGRQRG